MSKPINWLRVTTQKLKIASISAFIAVFTIQAFGLPVIAQGVVISEFLPSPVVVNSTNGEWIELHNVTDEVQDIEGWTVSDVNLTHTLESVNLVGASTFSIPGQGYFLLCRNADNTQNSGITNCDYEWGNNDVVTLNNTGDTLRLGDLDDGTTDDEVTYSEDDVNDGDSIVVNRDSDEEPVLTNDSINSYGDGDNNGTPGVANEDVLPPTLTITSPADEEFVSDGFNVTGTAYDGESGLDSSSIIVKNLDTAANVYTADQEVVGFNDNFNFSVPALGDGKYELSVTVMDQNSNETTKSVTVEIDTTKPVVTVHSQETNDRTPKISGSIDDPTAAISVVVDGNTYTAINDGLGAWSIADNIISILADGTYDVEVTATDLADNPGYDATNNELYVDGTAPVVTVTETTSFSHSPKLTGAIDDPNASVVIEVRGQTYAATNHGDGTWSLSGITFTPNGTHGTFNVIATATDTLGNVGTDATDNELTITGFLQGVASMGASFVGSITSGNANADADETATNGAETNDKDSKATEKADVASKDDDQAFDWRWLILTGAIIAFLWFLLKGREEESA